MRKTALCGAITLTLFAAATPAVAGPSGQALSFTCAGCHGTDGSSVGPSSPTLAGMPKDAFVDAMKSYKAGERNPTIMDRIAKGYTDDQFVAMAEFFAAQKRHTMAQEHDAAKAATGAKLHEEYCEKCHEDGGMSGEDSAPLAGQWAKYLEFTMADYKAEKRDMPKKMKKKIEAVEKDHGDAGVEALIQYYASQK